MTTQSVHLAWGARVSHALALRVIQSGKDFNFPPDWLMACMAFESGLNPAAHNPHSSATGLIQEMEATAEHYKTTTALLAAMTAEHQFDYVWLYFRDAIRERGPITSLADCYMAILDPAGMGKPDDYVLWSDPSSPYKVNAGLDANKDHQITKAEAAARVNAKLIEGLGPTNAADIIIEEQPAPQQETLMSKVTDAFHFVFDHLFASTARAAATVDPQVSGPAIATIQTTPMPSSGSANSTAGQASPILGKLEDDLNNVVMSFVKSTVDQLPVVGGVAEVTGLDQQAADAAKALLVLGEQHALTYISALFSAHHVAVNNSTLPTQAQVQAGGQG